jgi:PIN domain nuclease of toxin-antitoxin system
VKLLLDTPTSLWFIGGSGRLSAHARQLIEDQGNDRYVCVARLWEMTITVSIGKLSVPLPFTRLVRQHILGNAIDVLPVGPSIFTSSGNCLSIIGTHSTGLLSLRRSQKK